MGHLKKSLSSELMPAASNAGSKPIPKPWNLGLALKIFFMAVVNGVAEEATFRSLFLPRLEQSGLGEVQANLFQALSFGIFHWHGTPSGPTGVTLAFIYGSVMGWLVQSRGGILTPVIAHSSADYFIFAVLVRHTGGQGLRRTQTRLGAL